jgi:hypothetical protein
MTPVVEAGRDVVGMRDGSVVFLSVNNSERSLSVSDEGTASVSIFGGEVVDISPELVDDY